MNVLVFCDPAYRAADFLSGFRGSGHRVSFVCCNTSRTGHTSRFYVSQLYGAIRHNPAWIPALFWMWLLGRLLIAHDYVDSPRILSFIKRANPDLALHALGVIYPPAVISACGMGILNAHIGALPKYRGRSVMEWSIVCGDSTGVTVFFIDPGIDTGHRIIFFQPLSIAERLSISDAKRYLFSRDVELYKRAVNDIAAGRAFTFNNLSDGARFFEMSRLFRRVVEERFPNG